MTYLAPRNASRRSVVTQTFAGSPFSLMTRLTNVSICEVRVVLGAMSANSVSCRPGVPRMSRMNVWQKTILPAPMMATFAIVSSIG